MIKNVNKKLKFVQKMCKSKGGIFLSKAYYGATKLHKWQCNKSHIWETTPAIVNAGHWCSFCSRERLYKKSRNNIENIILFAQKHNGELLETKYKNNKAPMKWSCSHDH